MPQQQQRQQQQRQQQQRQQQQRRRAAWVFKVIELKSNTTNFKNVHEYGKRSGIICENLLMLGAFLDAYTQFHFWLSKLSSLMKIKISYENEADLINFLKIKI